MMVINISMKSEAFLILNLQWCGRGDLNPHAFRRHPLKMVCLPVPPLPQFQLLQPISSTAVSGAGAIRGMLFSMLSCPAMDCNDQPTAAISRAIAGFGRCRRNCGLFYIVRTLLLLPREKSWPAVWQL